MPTSSLLSWVRSPLRWLALLTFGWWIGPRTVQAGPLSPPRDCSQAMVVVADDWTSSTARLQRFARANPTTAWAPVGDPVPVVIGSSGLGWGLGLHRSPNSQDPRKVEGDRRAPAGVFQLGEAFGTRAADALSGLKWPYRKITPTLEAVDDPRSRFYNQIVDRAEIPHPDWRCSEKMSAISVYELGLVVSHNAERLPGRGSCIFLHLQSSNDTGTAGCTALRRADLLALLLWLDPARQPVLVQLPRAIAARGLPEFAPYRPQ